MDQRLSIVRRRSSPTSLIKDKAAAALETEIVARIQAIESALRRNAITVAEAHMLIEDELGKLHTRAGVSLLTGQRSRIALGVVPLFNTERRGKPIDDQYT
jgi:hypothetical protein